MTQRSGGAPPGWLQMMIGLAGLVLSAAAILITVNKTNAEDTRRLDEEMDKLRNRVCALEIRGGREECGERR